MAIKRSSVLSNTSANTKSDEVSEFDGLWLNLGVLQGDDEETAKFVRLPRGVAVGDLMPRRLYDRTIAENPDYAAEVQMVNNLIALIQKKALTLAEGESVPLKLEVQLYRKQEESAEAKPVAADIEALEAAIF